MKPYPQNKYCQCWEAHYYVCLNAGFNEAKCGHDVHVYFGLKRATIEAWKCNIHDLSGNHDDRPTDQPRRGGHSNRRT